ncbi:hypothetical protein C8R46DRAFT_1363099, partial [Mycena filopes]
MGLWGIIQSSVAMPLPSPVAVLSFIVVHFPGRLIFVVIHIWIFFVRLLVVGGHLKRIVGPLVLAAARPLSGHKFHPPCAARSAISSTACTTLICVLSQYKGAFD